ncbi:MAG: septum formation initiator family protein [Thermodesulfobacteriota bacterium]
MPPFRSHRHTLMDNAPSNPEKWLLLGSILLLALLAGWHLLSDRGLIHYLALQRQLAAVQQENDALQAENRSLSKEINQLRNDTDYFIDRARKEYGLIKKNEIIFDFSKH